MNLPRGVASLETWLALSREHEKDSGPTPTD